MWLKKKLTNIDGMLDIKFKSNYHKIENIGFLIIIIEITLVILVIFLNN